MSISKFIHDLSRKAMLVAVCGFVMHASAASNASSRLSEGRWVKIKVRESGIHQITFDQLREWGFSNPSKVAIYGFPAVELSSYTLTADRLIDLPPVASRVEGSKILFYGSGDVELEAINGNLPTGYNTGTYASVKRNYYADYGTYFLTDSQPATALEEIAYSGPGYSTDALGIKGDSYGMSIYERELQNESHLGARFWDEMIPDGESRSYNVAMPGFNPDGGRVNFLLYVGHCAQSAGTQPVGLPSGAVSKTLYLSKQNSTEMWLYGQSVMLYDNDSPENAILRTDNDLYPITINKEKAGNLTIDYITALYPTLNTLGNRPQAMFTKSDITETDVLKFVGDTDADIEIWDVTEPCITRRFATLKTANEGEVWVSSPGRFNSAATTSGNTRQFARIVAFYPGMEQLPVEFDGVIENQNLHAMPTPDMVIITASDFMQQANRLADIHRLHGGLDVAVVTQEQVYNEFSSGTPMIMALRSFARRLYDGNQSKFRSVLLIGAAHWNNLYLNEDADAIRRTNIPMFLCEQGDAVGSYPLSYKTDAFIGMLKDNTAKLDLFNSDMMISVGRIPAPSAADVTSYIDKVENYLSNPPSPEIYNTVIIASDEGDRNGHLLDGNQLGTDIVALAPGTTIMKAPNAIYPYENGAARVLNNKIKQGLSQGVALMTFNGHSLSTFALGAGYVWDVTKVGSTSYDVPPLVFLATCNAAEPSQSTKSITEAMLAKTDGGAIGVISACRSVYMDENQYLGREVVEKIYLHRNQATMGTVMMDAHNGLIADSPSSTFRNRAMANRLAFNLYGDPEIPVPQPDRYVQITAINGAPASKNVSVDADSRMKIEGEIVDASGTHDPAFNGNIKINIYDSPLTVPVINATGQYLDQKVELDEDILVESVAKVEGGKFTAELYVPTPRDAASNRMQFFAESTEGGLVRDGWDGLSIIPSGEPTANDAETAMPVIAEMYVNTPDFSNGDVVNGIGSVLYARVEANDYGLVGKNSTPGKALKVMLDDSKSLPYASNGFSIDVEGEGSLQFPLPTLADGPHTLTLYVSNNAGQTANAAVSFVVVNEAIEAQLSVDESPARSFATINIEGVDTGSLSGLLVVRDAAGKAVHTVENPTFPYRWNLLDAESNPVEAGYYTVGAYVRSGNNFGSARPCSLIVHY